MKLPELRIGKLVAKVPVIQGGMAIRLSTAPLAAAVALLGLYLLSSVPGARLKPGLATRRERAAGESEHG